MIEKKVDLEVRLNILKKALRNVHIARRSLVRRDKS